MSLEPSAVTQAITSADIHARADEDTLYFEGDSLQALCDLLELGHEPWPGAWATARTSRRVIGQRLPRLWMDETERTGLGEGYGRDWMIEP